MAPSLNTNPREHGSFKYTLTKSAKSQLIPILASRVPAIDVSLHADALEFVCDILCIASIVSAVAS